MLNLPVQDTANTKLDLDIRYFRRYPKQADFLLSCKAGLFKARMVDYSLIGLGITIEDVETPIHKGDGVAVDIDDPDLYGLGKVAWTAKTTSGLRVGVLKTKPLKGRLSVYPLSDVLVSLQRTMKTGVLEVSQGAMRKSVFIRNGEIISAASNYEKDRLGDVLLKNRKINRKQYDRAAEMKRKSGSSYIAVLLHMNYLNLEGLMRARQLQMRRIIASLFLMRDAEFEFIEGLLPPEDEIIVNFPIADVIYREMKKSADIGLIQNYLLDSVVDFASKPLTLFQTLRITSTDKAVLAHVNGNRTIGDIGRLAVSHKGVNPLKVIYALLEARFLKITEPADVAPSSAVADEVAPCTEESVPFNEAINKLYAEYKDLDYYRLLGVQSGDSAEEIRKAYLRAERAYHPDMYQLIDIDVKRKLVEIFASLRDAYLTLSDPGKRREYDAAREKADAKEETAPEDRPDIPIVQENLLQNNSDWGGQTYGTPHKGNSDKALPLFREGKVSFWENDFAKAARLFARAITFDASVPEYHYMYGRTLGNLGKNKEAVQALNRANELKPLDPDTLAELGHLYLRMGFHLRAEGYFNRALARDPSHKRAREGIQARGKKKPRS
jgi:curved DNA-binding protein CbpA